MSKQPAAPAPQLSSAAEPCAIRIDNLGHAYRAGEWVLRHCNAAVTRGKVFAILGPNGRGKTTLLKLMLGVLKPAEGTVERVGECAFVPQIFQVSFDYTALDMVVMGRAKRVSLFSQPSHEDEAAAFSALEKFGLAAVANRPFQELSGGQRQMVILARSLVARADLLILDEPTSALDLKNQALILDWITRLSRESGLTVVFSTHHPQHALAVADDVMLMLDADRHVVGPQATILSEANLTELYGIPLKRISFAHNGEMFETFAPVPRSS